MAGVGTNTIARNLTKDKIKAFETKDAWNVSTITKWLTSKTVIGHLQPHIHFSRKKRIEEGDIIENYYPAIIKESDFYEAQELRKRRLISRGPKKNKHNLFTGIIKCKKCGGSMAMRTGAVTKKRTNPYRTLVCGRAWRGGKCKFATIPYLHIEDIILTLVFSNIAKTMTLKENNPEEKILSIDGQIEENKRKIDKIIHTIENENVTSKSLTSRLIQIENENEKLLEKKKNIPKSDSIGWIRELYQNWEPLENNTENRNKVASILKRIIYIIEIDAIKQEGHLKFNSNPEIDNIIKWDKKDKSYYVLNDHKLPKAPSIVWINEGRIIPIDRIIKMKRNFRLPDDLKILDEYVVFIPLEKTNTTFRALVTKDGTYYKKEVVNDNENYECIIYKDKEPPFSINLN